MKKEKIANIVLFALVIILLLSTIAYAAPITDVMQGGLVRINEFFNGQYAPYSKALDFFFFSFLFIAVYMMGARYAFKEMKRPEQMIVILLGLATAFLLVLRDISITSLLPWIHWILYVLLFMLYWWMLKGIESKFWRFITALLLTILTIMLMQGLFDYFSAPKVPSINAPSLPKTSFFKNFGLNFKPTLSNPFSNFNLGLKKDTSETAIKETTTPGTPTPTPEGAAGGTTPPEKKNSWWWLWLLLISLLLWLIWKFRDKLPRRARRERAAATAAETQEGFTIQKIIDELTKIIELKDRILKKIREIIRRKGELSREYLDAYHKTIRDIAFLSDRESPEYKNLMQQQDDVSQLLNVEMELENDLLELRDIEENLSGNSTKRSKLVEWQDFIKKTYLTPREQSGEMPASAEWQKESIANILRSFEELMHDNEGIVPKIKRIIAGFFLVTNKEKNVEKLLKQLTDLEKLQRWIKEGKYERWKDIKDKEAAELLEYFQQEEKTFFNGQLIPAVHWQMRLMQRIREHLKFLESNRKSFTELQELNAAIKDPNDSGKWVDVTKEATTLPGINSQLIKIYTNFAGGIAPYKVVCYVNGVAKANKVVDKNYAVEPVIQFTTDEIGQLNSGRNVISILAISARDTYRRMAQKSIEIFINGDAQIPKQDPKTGKKKVMILAPLNSTPEKPIYLFSHAAGKNKLVINKEHNPNALCQVSLADTSIKPKASSKTQFEIQYYADSNFFYLTKFFENAVVRVDGKEIEYDVEFLLKQGMIVELNEYKFQVGIHDITGNIPTLEKYQGQFPIILRRGFMPNMPQPSSMSNLLILTPVNSIPKKQITIIGEHSIGKGTIKFAKDRENQRNTQIIFVDTSITPRVENEMQFRIEFWGGNFQLTKHFGTIEMKSSEEEPYVPVIELTMQLKNQTYLKLNEYEFHVAIARIMQAPLPFEEYWRQFPIFLGLEQTKVISPREETKSIGMVKITSPDQKIPIYLGDMINFKAVVDASRIAGKIYGYRVVGINMEEEDAEERKLTEGLVRPEGISAGIPSDSLGTGMHTLGVVIYLSQEVIESDYVTINIYPKEEKGRIQIPDAHWQMPKEIEGAEEELTELDEIIIREEIKAQRDPRRATSAFMRAFEVLLEERKKISGMVRRARRNILSQKKKKVLLKTMNGASEQERQKINEILARSDILTRVDHLIDPLMKKLDVNIHWAKKTSKFSYINAARDNIHELTSFITTAPISKDESQQPYQGKQGITQSRRLEWKEPPSRSISDSTSFDYRNFQDTSTTRIPQKRIGKVEGSRR